MIFDKATKAIQCRNKITDAGITGMSIPNKETNKKPRTKNLDTDFTTFQKLTQNVP